MLERSCDSRPNSRSRSHADIQKVQLQPSGPEDPGIPEKQKQLNPGLIRLVLETRLPRPQGHVTTSSSAQERLGTVPVLDNLHTGALHVLQSLRAKHLVHHTGYRPSNPAP